MSVDNLLFELGTEELPPKSLKKLATALCDNLTKEIESASLSYSSVKWYATPRRLAVYFADIEGQQQDQVVEKRGPAVNVAFDSEGNPSRAALGWAKSNGIDISEADRLTTPKGEWLLHKATQLGKSISDLFPEMVQRSVSKLPIPKPMRWGGNKIQFIRPVHTVTMLFGSTLINGEVLGVQSSNIITGHRFHHHGLLSLNNASDYVETLRSAHVVVDYDERKTIIAEGIKQAAIALNGTAFSDESLLEEVTSLVEWPVTLVGSFDDAFLAVPSEPLIYSMKDHQKYFPVLDNEGALMPKFIFITNINSKDPNQIILGNEKVVRPRLADAEFFFNTDKKQTLEQRLSTLESVLFQKQLGTLKEKSERIAQLSKLFAAQINCDDNNAERAGLLSKTDLMTEMVLEFPEVQGTMGKYYAINDGEHADVAQALEDQYRPKFSGDSLPEGNVGAVVALADKIDSLVGIFGINQAPKGDKDPFALRRAAIGLLRIIIEKELPFDFEAMAEAAANAYGDKLSNGNVVKDVVDFVVGRYRAYYQERGVSTDVIQSVLANKATKPVDFDKRVNAVSYFKSLPESSTLAAANKRVGNILTKFDGQLSTAFNLSIATDDAELNLAKVYADIELQLKDLYVSKDYQLILTKLSALKEPVDEFFDKVLVMADDESIKVNRLSLLNNIRNSFYQVADISVLQ